MRTATTTGAVAALPALVVGAKKVNEITWMADPSIDPGDAANAVARESHPADGRAMKVHLSLLAAVALVATGCKTTDVHEERPARAAVDRVEVQLIHGTIGGGHDCQCDEQVACS